MPPDVNSALCASGEIDQYPGPPQDAGRATARSCSHGSSAVWNSALSARVCGTSLHAPEEPPDLSKRRTGSVVSTAGTPRAISATSRA